MLIFDFGTRQELQLLGLLIAGAALLILAGPLNIPYPILLVLGGLLLAFGPGVPKVTMPPEVVLVGILPPLLYQAAYATGLRELRRNLRPISLLAVGLVLLTTCGVAVVAHAITDLGWAEAFVLGEKLGLSHQALFDVASTSSGQCWSLTTYCPVPGPVPTSPANNDYKPGFASALMVKDLTLAQDAAKAAGAATPLGKHAQEIYQSFDAAGQGGVDFSGIIKHVRGLAGKA